MPAHTIERTLAIIKPDAFSFRLCGVIIGEIEKSELNLVGAKILKLNRKQAETFYDIHREKPFFKRLVAFMTSGPIMVLALEGKEAVSSWRKMMGTTDPEEAADGTIRKMFASDVTFNAVHGSDSPETARREIDFFFKPDEIIELVHH